MNFKSAANEVVIGNSTGGIILSYMSPNIFWSTRELYAALTNPAKRLRGTSDREYRAIDAKCPKFLFFSFSSFTVTMCKLAARGFLKPRTVRGEGFPYMVYRLADGVTREAIRPKSEEGVFNELKLAAKEAPAFR